MGREVLEIALERPLARLVEHCEERSRRTGFTEPSDAARERRTRRGDRDDPPREDGQARGGRPSEASGLVADDVRVRSGRVLEIDERSHHA
jgi:hypothetical protein